MLRQKDKRATKQKEQREKKHLFAKIALSLQEPKSQRKMFDRKNKMSQRLGSKSLEKDQLLSQQYKKGMTQSTKLLFLV
jgi:hypothetical protein